METWVRYGCEPPIADAIEFMCNKYNDGATEFEITYKDQFVRNERTVTMVVTTDLVSLFRIAPFVVKVTAFKYKERKYSIIPTNFLNAYEEALDLQRQYKKDICITLGKDCAADPDTYTIDWWKKNFELKLLATGGWVVSYFD